MLQFSLLELAAAAAIILTLAVIATVVLSGAKCKAELAALLTLLNQLRDLLARSVQTFQRRGDIRKKVEEIKKQVEKMGKDCLKKADKDLRTVYELVKKQYDDMRERDDPRMGGLNPPEDLHEPLPEDPFSEDEDKK